MFSTLSWNVIFPPTHHENPFQELREIIGKKGEKISWCDGASLESELHLQPAQNGFMDSHSMLLMQVIIFFACSFTYLTYTVFSFSRGIFLEYGSWVFYVVSHESIAWGLHFVLIKIILFQWWTCFQNFIVLLSSQGGDFHYLQRELL